ncbi:hypothetical protein CBF23_009480, partial [Marinomonas agarivorans]
MGILCCLFFILLYKAVFMLRFPSVLSSFLSFFSSLSLRFFRFIAVFFVLPSAHVAFATDLVGSLVGEADVNYAGAATYEIPLDLPNGINGLEPNLELRYNSQQGNGLLGLGWSLTGQSDIHRCAANQAQDGFIAAPKFDNDRFCLDGEKLLAINGKYGDVGTQYRLENDPLTKVFAIAGDKGAPDSWQVVQQNGQVFAYGASDNSTLLANGTHAGKPLKWGLASIADGSGNQIHYSYHNDQATGDLRLNEIAYNGYRVVFKYEARGDKQFSYNAGSKEEVTQRLQQIRLYHATTLVYQHTLDYQEEGPIKRSQLASIEQCDGLGLCLPKVQINWTLYDFDSKNWRWKSGHGSGKNGWQLADVFGDGRQVYWTRTGNTHYVTRLNEDGTLQNWRWKSGHGSGKNG